MKPIRQLVVQMWLVGAVALLVACSMPPANNPRAIGEAFLNHLKSMEFKEASEMATDSAKQILLYLESLKPSLPQDRIDQSKAKGVTILNVTEKGDVATITYKMGSDDEQSLDLVKVGGTWKVDFKKQL